MQSTYRIPANCNLYFHRGQGYPTSIVEVRSVALSDISPPTSPPALSPNPSDTSFCSSDSANSEVTSPTTTDLGSDIATSAFDETDHEALIESESESRTALLDSRLLSVLRYDLELAARLIPRIHARIQWRFASKKIGVTVVPSQAGEGGHTSPSTVSSSSPAVSRTVNPTDLQRRKHIRDPDEEDEARRNRGSKTPRKRFGPDSPRPLGFACPFYRKDPEKYVVATDIKYRTYGGPGPYEVRRIKDHFKSSHRTPKCDRCYCIFEDVTQLTNHRRSEPPCAQNGIKLKEGIDDGQWEVIERLLSRKRGASQSENEKHDIKKWFGIWTILFPNIYPPKHPWSDTSPVKPAPLTLEVANLIDTLDRVIE
ncbi:hypothetical protein BGZ57DRAFT_954771 [Hyaloscypha finlandica]|nr:hypothetical protein BGZ57DRAFT_954771 [Hyaloscypha finlandica]